MRPLAAILCIGLVAARVASSTDAIREADYATGYFGELLPSLTSAQSTSAANGFKLFVKSWPEGAAFRRNADSCVACHNVPMPAGSGMSEQALVAVDARQEPGSVQEVVQRGFPITPQAARGEVRRTPPLFGLGYLEFASAGEAADRGGLGAFGTIQDARSFVARTFAIELGISSTGHCARALSAAANPETCAPAISAAELDDLVTYLRVLAPPPRRPVPKGSTGAQLFRTIGCAGCHRPTSVTRTDAPEPLRARRFTAYTDRRAHDMGARASLVTRPLWGLNSVGPPYMHDACGDSIAGAIDCHRGEGRQAADSFARMSGADRNELLAYLRLL